MLETPRESVQWFQSYSNWKILETIDNKRNAFLFLSVTHNQCSRLPTDPARSQNMLFKLPWDIQLCLFDVKNYIYWILIESISSADCIKKVSPVSNSYLFSKSYVVWTSYNVNQLEIVVRKSSTWCWEGNQEKQKLWKVTNILLIFRQKKKSMSQLPWVKNPMRYANMWEKTTDAIKSQFLKAMRTGS